MVFRIIFMVLLSSVLVSCLQDNNSSSQSTVNNCTSATGSWGLTSVSCNGVTQEAADSFSINFNSEGVVNQTQGSSSCHSSTNWDYSSELVGLTLTFDLTGSGSMSCSEDGLSVSGCSSASNSCDASFNMEGLINNYAACSYSNGVMTINRTVTNSNDPNNFSFCQSGESETLTLAQYVESEPSDPPSERAILNLSGVDPMDFGTVNVGNSSSITLTITNSGTVGATALNGSSLTTPFRFLGGAYPGTGGTCAATLSASLSCDLVIDFSPTVAGTFNDSLIISYNDGTQVENISRDLFGTGMNSVAILNISDGPSFDYGSVSVGSSSSHIFIVFNTGSGVASAMTEVGLAAPFLFSGGSYPGTAGSCAMALMPGSSCALDIKYAPSVIGTENDQIELYYNDSVSSQTTTRGLSGTGTR